ncbi:MAG: DUF3987 domain-containing protein [Clostridia bacterium]|nr:DUF3987 domain-containing protein [Clostridia bacterium]
MRKLDLAFGYSRSSKVWRNTSMTFEEICAFLEEPVRTGETMDEYRHLSRDEKSAIKDIDPFVCGRLIGTRRKKEDVEHRSMLSFDGDDVTVDFVQHYREIMPYASCLYSTHSSTPEQPRCRILVPLTRDVTPHEFNALSRLFVAEPGTEMFDPFSHRINQPMFKGSVPKDGEYLFIVTDKAWLDPDAFSEKYPGWEDASALPLARGENQKKTAPGKKQEDPLTKDGIVGAFCRTYGIEEAIATFLPDVYEPSVVDGRYSYIPGEGTAGVVVYDDKFAYSHHATDPAGGRQLNAFDLVRLHKFPDSDEKKSFHDMAEFAKQDKRVRSALTSADFEVEIEPNNSQAAVKKTGTTAWEDPIPFGGHTLMPFPLDALPAEIRDYVAALSESVQTPVDLAGTAALGVIATCVQGKFTIQGKPDWVEPLNLYLTAIASSFERKSAVQKALVRPINDYEEQYNLTHAAAVEASRMRGRILLRRQKAVEEQFAKGKAEPKEVDQIASEVAEHEDLQPMRLFVDDITPEKLASVLAQNNGRMAVLSSEAGIFDTLAGAYAKLVNIDVMLKGYSGDPIRVDRIRRDSESIMRPTLTVLLMAQPGVISKVLGNTTFRGRGLTARFLFSMPVLSVGSREYRTPGVLQNVYAAYARRLVDMLEDDYGDEPEMITLSPEADALLEQFSRDLEPKLVKEYAEIADWCGKLAGNTLRIAGLLCRASASRAHDFIDANDPLVVDGQTMRNAIRLGTYFLNHAQAVFNVLPENDMFQNAQRILKMICEKKLTAFNRRTAMRYCQMFKRVEDIQPVLDFLEDYGYIASVEALQTGGKGRPPMTKYIVNPAAEQYFRHERMTNVMSVSDTNQR